MVHEPLNRRGENPIAQASEYDDAPQFLFRPPRADGSLPGVPTPLIGRDDDIVSIGKLFAIPSTRLASLVGPGGVGKTRLALAVAETLRANFRDGVRWVGLDGVPDSERALAALLGAFGIPEAADDAALEQVCGVLAAMDVILILDNCESVLGLASTLADLLARCPGVRIVATSRIPLRLRWERLWLVTPLDPPTADEAADEAAVDALRGNPAVALFLDRLPPQYGVARLAATALATVAAICAYLDGLPLALELAAARARTISLDRLLEQLRAGGGLDTLGDGPIDLPTRQRAIRDTIAWSEALLDWEGRVSFRALGVFGDSFSAEAAEAVAGVTDLAPLVDASLVQTIVATDGTIRFRLLHIIGDYARIALETDGTLAAAARRHLDFFVALANAGEAGLLGPDAHRWMDLLDEERGNFQRAATWAIEAEETVAVLGMIGALGSYWIRRGYLRQVRTLIELALALPPRGPAAVRFRALQTAAQVYIFWGDRPRQRAVIAEIERLALASDDPGERGEALIEEASAAITKGDYAAARGLLEQSLAYLLSAGAQARVAHALVLLGAATAYDGELTASYAVLDRALTLAEELGARHVIGGVYFQRGWLALLDGDIQGARRFAARCLATAPLGDVQARAYLHQLFGMLALADNDLPRAHEALLAGVRAYIAQGNHYQLIDGVEAVAGLATAQGRYAMAARLRGATEAAREAQGTHPSALTRRALDRVMAELRAHLSPEEYERTYAAGRLLTLADASAEALALPVTAALDEPAAERESPLPPAAAPLTPQQLVVARLIAEGFSNPAIGTALKISRRTADAHVQHILERLRLENRAQIAFWYQSQAGS